MKTSLAWAGLLGLSLIGAGSALAHDPGGTPDGGAAVAEGADIRRAPGLPPGGNAPAPAPRALTPAELDELRLRMIGGTRGTILKPDEVKDLRRSVQDAQGAGNFPGRDGRLPRPEPRTLSVGEHTSVSKPETLHLAYGVVSPITFVDAKGRPWPIASVAYDPRLFAQDGTGCGTDNGVGSSQVAASAGSDRPTSINLMPCRFETWGNILIRLEGFAYPIPLMVLSGSNERVDIPVTVRVAGSSPLQPLKVAVASPAPRPSRGPAPPRASGEANTTQALHLFASGTPPRGAYPVNATGGAQAWIYRDRMYVRASGNLVSPQPVGSADGPGGVKVWEFNRPASRLIAEAGDGSETTIAVDY